MSDIAKIAEIRPNAEQHAEQHAAPHTEQQTAPHAEQNTEPQTAPSELKDICVSEASEMTGHSQTTRNELNHLFGTCLPSFKDETKDKLVRAEARDVYVNKLHESGVTVKYVLNKCNKQLMVVVSCNGKTVERAVYDDRRSAARKAFVALLRSCNIWPIPDRFKPMPVYPLAKPTSVQSLSETVHANLGEASSCIQAAAEKAAAPEATATEKATAEKEVTRAEFEAMRADLEAMRTKFEQCKKAAEAEVALEAKARAAAEAITAEAIADVIAEVAAEAIAEAKARAVVEAIAAEVIAVAIADVIAEVAVEVIAEARAAEARAAEAIAEAKARADVEAQAELEAMRTKLEAMRTELEQYKKAEKEQAQPSLIPVSAAKSQTTVSNETDETEAAASLLELMRDPQISKKRDRDPLTGSGGSAQKKTKVNDDDDYQDMDAVMERLSMAEKNGEININSFKRLQMLQRLLNECERDGLITIKTNEINKCILGWSKLSVKELKKFYKKILDMIVQDQTGIWRKFNQTLKNPTLAVYELFRRIGVKPGFRGPNEDDPGKHDMFYYEEWEFKNDESFKKARKRSVKGFDPRKK